MDLAFLPYEHMTLGRSSAYKIDHLPLGRPGHKTKTWWNGTQAKEEFWSSSELCLVTLGTTKLPMAIISLQACLPKSYSWKLNTKTANRLLRSLFLSNTSINRFVALVDVGYAEFIRLNQNTIPSTMAPLTQLEDTLLRIMTGAAGPSSVTEMPLFLVTAYG